MTTDPKPAMFKLSFRIEQLPDGTFVGKSDNPKLEIKGATPQEVQQKIQQSMGSHFIEKLGIHMAAAVTNDGVELTGTKDGASPGSPGSSDAPGFTPPAFRSAESQRPQFQTREPEISGTAPITAEPIDAGSVRTQKLLGALLVIAAALLAYW